MFTGAPGGGGDVARAAAAELPPELRRPRLALEALELIVGLLRRRRAARQPGCAEPTATAADGRRRRARRCSRRLAAWQWANSGGTADECVALALEALAGGELLGADNGLMLGRADRRARARRPRGGGATTCGGRSRTRTAAARCSRDRGVHLWRGFDAAAARRAGRGRGRRCARRSRSSAAGARRRRRCCTPAAFLAEMLLERGDLAGARAALEPRRRPRRRSDGARCWLRHASWSCCSPRAAPRRRSRSPTSSTRAVAAARQPGGYAAGARCKAQALDRARPRATRPSRSPRRSSSWRAAGARRGPSAGRCACSARCEREDGLAAPRGGRRGARAARPRGSSTPRRWPRSARRCGARAGRPRRASRCAARSSSRRLRRRALVEHVRAELHATGARPRSDGAQRRRGADRERAPRRRPGRRRRRPTATSRRRSSSRRRPSRCTSRTPTASSASARAASSRAPSSARLRARTATLGVAPQNPGVPV